MIGLAKKLVLKIIDAHAGAIAKRLSMKERDLFHQAQKSATAEALEYLRAHMRSAVGLQSDVALLRYAISKAPKDGLIMEFGVFKGRTITIIANAAGRTVHGFDSFIGLPEDWTGWKQPAGHFSLGGQLPIVPSNVVLHKGWFKDTLPVFLSAQKAPADLIHIHCDLYSSTKEVLENLRDRIRPGTIIVLHEYFNHFNWRDHEYKAFQEFVKNANVRYTYLAYSSSEAGQACVRIDSIG